MSWNPDLFREHFIELSRQMKRQAFWKTALFGVLLLERQWPVYERLSVGRAWGASKEVRRVLDRLWKGVPSGMRLDDKYLLMLEENPVAPKEEPWDWVASCMVEHSLALIYIFRKKDNKAAGELAEKNLRCLCFFLDACGEECTPEHPLAAAEMAFQRELCQRLCQVPNKDKNVFLEQCRGEDQGSLLGESWFFDYPDYPPLKRKAKKLPALRYAHLRYEEYVQAAKQRDEQGQNAWDREKQQLALYNSWLEWSDKMPNNCSIPDPLIQHVTRRWPMPESLAEIYNYLALHIELGAQSCWACTEDPELVSAMFWLAARAQEACYALLDRGWPCSGYLAYENSMHKYLIGPAFKAICAGDWDLAALLLKHWHKPLKLRGELAPWRTIPATRVWLALIQGDDEQARLLIEKETQSKCPPTDKQRLWPHLYPWDDWEEDCETFRLLLDGDKKGLEKKIIGGIRAIRAQYEFSTTTLSSYNLALWKLARRRGMDLNLPLVSEMPAALLEDVPLDGEKWKLPGQAVLDEALGAQGMELLNRWKQLAEEG